jgi:iron complex outermembrane recepter protein
VPPGGDPALRTIGLLDIPLNGSGGYVKGVEWAGSFPLNMLDKSLDGFGVFASISANSSSVRLPAGGFSLAEINGSPALPLPGLSKRSGNITLYYEKAGFGLRVAQRHRSAFLGEITDNVGDRRLTFVKGERIVDAQISYEFQSGFAKGLSLLFQGSNLNNAEFVRYREKPITPSTTAERTKYGSFYLFGVNYKL